MTTKNNEGIDSILWEAYKELPPTLRNIIMKEKYFIACLRFKGKSEGYIVVDLMKKTTSFPDVESYADHVVDIYNEFINYQKTHGKLFSC